MMSEEEFETQDHQSAMDDMLDAIYQQNLTQSRTFFDQLMNDKISDALENEKVSIASQIYNTQPEEEEDYGLDVDEDEWNEYEASAEDESEWDESEWDESEVEDAFEEGDLEQELQQAEIDELEV